MGAAGAGMQENGQADYGGDGGGGFGGEAPRRAAAKSGGKGGFDKQLDDEIPF